LQFDTIDDEEERMVGWN